MKIIISAFLLLFNFSFSQTYSIFIDFSNNKSYLENDLTGKLKTDGYDNINRIENPNYFITRNNDKYGLISKAGEPILKNIYDKIFVNDCEIITTKNGEKEVLIIDENNTKCKKSNFIIEKKGKKYGVKNSNSEIILPYKYDFIKPYGIVFENQKVGLVDSLGREILPVNYEEISKFSTNMNVNCLIKNENCEKNDWYVATKRIKENFFMGVINSKGETLIPIEYSHIIPVMDNSNIFPASKNGKYGFINIHNIVIIPFIYDRVSAFENGLASVEIDHKFGMIDRNNKIIIPFNDYDDFYLKFKSGIAVFSTNGRTKYGLINNKGKIVVNNIYDEIINFYDSEYYYVRRSNKVGVIDSFGKIIIPLLYDNINFVNMPINNVFIFTLDKKMGIIDKNNKILIPNNYENISIGYNVISLYKNGCFELMNNDFSLISKTRFKNYCSSNQEKISVQDENGKSYNIDKNGNITTKK